jgi:hypothetical protein
MTDATDLWTAVEGSYDSDGLITLTNIRDQSQNVINTAVGQDAAQGVIDLWPIYAQVAYDGTDGTHLEIAKQGTIAILWRRGGSSTEIEQVRYDTVFSDDGLLGKLKDTSPRGRQGPVSNSGVSTSPETVNGSQVKGWSDRDASGADFMTARRETAD